MYFNNLENFKTTYYVQKWALNIISLFCIYDKNYVVTHTCTHTLTIYNLYSCMYECVSMFRNCGQVYEIRIFIHSQNNQHFWLWSTTVRVPQKMNGSCFYRFNSLNIGLSLFKMEMVRWIVSQSNAHCMEMSSEVQLYLVD